jgi:hypothetical protein
VKKREFIMTHSDSSLSSLSDSNSNDHGYQAFLTREKLKGQTNLVQFEAFRNNDKDATSTNSVTEQMKQVLALRQSLGMDKDVEFAKQQERKELEKKRLSNLSIEERIVYQEEMAAKQMQQIRIQQLEKNKQKEQERLRIEQKKRNDEQAKAEREIQRAIRDEERRIEYELEDLEAAQRLDEMRCQQDEDQCAASLRPAIVK